MTIYQKTSKRATRVSAAELSNLHNTLSLDILAIRQIFAVTNGRVISVTFLNVSAINRH